jgi:hypothetical protein
MTYATSLPHTTHPHTSDALSFHLRHQRSHVSIKFGGGLSGKLGSKLAKYASRKLRKFTASSATAADT